MHQSQLPLQRVIWKYQPWYDSWTITGTVSMTDSVVTVVQKLSDLHLLAAKLAGFEGQWGNGKIIKFQFE